jgi:hypothetical protein
MIKLFQNIACLFLFLFVSGYSFCQKTDSTDHSYPYIGISMTPEYNFFLSDAKLDKYYYYKAQPGGTISFQTNIKIIKNLYIESGLQFYLTWYKESSNRYKVYGKGVSKLPDITDLFYTFSAPLLVNKCFSRKKIDYLVGTGFSVDIIYKNQNKLKSESLMAGGFGFGITVHGGINYHYDEHGMLQIRPSFKYRSLNAYRKDEIYPRNNFTVGIEIGICKLIYPIKIRRPKQDRIKNNFMPFPFPVKKKQ